MKIKQNIKTMLPAVAFLFLFTVACDAPNRDETDESAGTSRAIVGDSSNLNEPRKSTITGDSAKTEEQRNKFGELPPNEQPLERVPME